MRDCGIRILLCIAVFAVCSAQARLNAQIEITLPESHWALESLAELASRNLVPGYTQPDFRGKRSFTRRETAKAISAILDHHTMRGEAFSAGDIAMLRELMAEFDEELKEMGETRIPGNAPPSPKIPLSHWSYAAFAEFARRGLLPGENERSFLGGKIHTRAEMSVFAKTMLDLKAKNIELFGDKDLKLLEYMEKEFKEELRGTGPVARAPRPGGAVLPKDDRKKLIRGHSNISARTSTGNKSAVSNRMSFSINKGRVVANMTGTSDNSKPGGFGFKLTQKQIGYHSHQDNRERDSFLLMGDISSVAFGRGLALGGANINGLYFSAAARGGSRAVVAWGKDNSDKDLLAARFTSAAAGPWVWGASIVKEYAAAATETRSFGFDLKHETASRRMNIERVWTGGAGNGFFAEWLRDYTKTLRLSMEYRNYKNFKLTHNSPATYTGRSGGNSENEKSYYGGVEWRPSDLWALTINRDRSYNPLIGKRTTLAHSIERKLTGKFFVGISGEKERGGNAPETERGAKLRYSGFGKTDLFSSWKRGTRAGAPSSVTRFDLSRPLQKQNGRFLYSFTRGKTRTRNTNASTFRLSGKLGEGLIVGLTYNISTNTKAMFDTDISWKF